LLRYVKFTEKDGKKIIDRASFQSFGCQTAIAVASMATEMLKGKTIEQAMNLSTQELSGDLGELPPMKIHCGQLVKGALRNALDNSITQLPTEKNSPTLSDQIQKSKSKVKLIWEKDNSKL
jgi:nitrogen fixation protein NifU and related proteins